MTREEAIRQLEECQNNNGDPEKAHITADCILLEFLTSLGYDDVVKAWDKIEPKWYA